MLPYGVRTFLLILKQVQHNAIRRPACSKNTLLDSAISNLIFTQHFKIIVNKNSEKASAKYTFAAAIFIFVTLA
tara:strand:- start:129144 stop:129365 length:222 start_codon:yes stop_codon:yes gene_type:complete